jgi:hypothetical protein
LGRRPLDSKQTKDISRQDMREHNAVEGGFGVCKRRYGLARIMARLKETAESVIALQFLVMNLEHVSGFFIAILYTPSWRLLEAEVVLFIWLSKISF